MSRPAPIVLIMAAGLGTRMKSDKAKVLHEVAGRPMIAWAIEAARAAGASRIVAILGHQLETVKAALDARYGAGAIEVAQQAEQKGTGHAVACALPALHGEPADRIALEAELVLHQHVEVDRHQGPHTARHLSKHRRGLELDVVVGQSWGVGLGPRRRGHAPGD